MPCGSQWTARRDEGLGRVRGLQAKVSFAVAALSGSGILLLGIGILRDYSLRNNV